MRHFLLCLTAFLTLTVARGQTSVYHQFPDSNAVWRQTRVWMVSQNPLCLLNNDFQYFLSGDTIVASKTYHKLFCSGHQYTSGSCPPQSSYYSYYAGAIRQDIIQRKIYFLPDSVSADTLLYDFNLSLGDTLSATYINSANGFFVNAIDSALVGTTYRKVFRLKEVITPNPTDSASLIEGVGSTKGLLTLTLNNYSNYYNLDCFLQNGKPQYPDTLNCILVPVSVLEQEKYIGLTISPNPFCSQTVLQSDDFLHNATLTVDNCFGQTVKQIKNISGQTVVISRDNLPSGLYFIRITQDSKTITVDKLVIADN